MMEGMIRREERSASAPNSYENIPQKRDRRSASSPVRPLPRMRTSSIDESNRFLHTKSPSDQRSISPRSIIRNKIKMNFTSQLR